MTTFTGNRPCSTGHPVGGDGPSPRNINCLGTPLPQALILPGPATGSTAGQLER